MSQIQPIRNDRETPTVEPPPTETEPAEKPITAPPEQIPETPAKPFTPPTEEPTECPRPDDDRELPTCQYSGGRWKGIGFPRSW